MSSLSRSHSPRAFLRAALCCACLVSVTSVPALGQSTNQPSGAQQKTIQRSFDLLPLSFEPNQGQSASDAKFLAQGRGFAALFKPNEADLLLASGHAGSPLRITLLHALQSTGMSGELRLPGTVNYLSGNDRRDWHTGIPTFQRLRYAGVYPGTDLVYYGNQGRLEFDFQVSPGASPNDIQLRLQGARTLTIDGKGDLVVTTEDGRIAFQKPAVYQTASGGRSETVAGSFRLLRNNTVGFAIGRYDHARPLIIDPILNYSTYLGSLADASSIAVDANGDAYVTGVAMLAFPTTSGSYQPVGISSTTAQDLWPNVGKPFIAKFNSTGTALVYSTFLSGSGIDAANGIAVDANGDAFVAGTTSSTDFPVTTGSLQMTNKASQTTGFVTELSSTGSSLLYSTYLGGSSFTMINAIAIDGSDDAYVTGRTLDTDFPTTQGAFQSAAVTKVSSNSYPQYSAFVAKLNPAGAALAYSTYVTGSQSDIGWGIAVDSAGEAYVGGYTSSVDFPVTSGALQTTRETSNVLSGFVTKLNASGSALAWSTYLGGNDFDRITSLALDSSGNVYAAGSTNSPDFPVTSGAFQTQVGISYYGYPQTNAFVSELNSTAGSLVYSTFLGGGVSWGPYADNGDQANGVAVDGQGMVYLTGSACTGDFPVTAGAFEPVDLAGEIDSFCTAFLTKLNPAPNTPLVYSTFFGGTGNGDPGDYFNAEIANGLAVDPSDNVYLAGYTNSIDFPVTAGVVETPFSGVTEEAFVSAFNASEMKSLPVPTVTLTSNTSSVLFGQPVTFTATVAPASGGSTPTGYVAFDFFQTEASDDEGFGVGFGPWTMVPVNGAGVATFTTSSVQFTQTPVNAFYLGDANNAPASANMIQALTDIGTTTTITASPSSAPYGTNITFTVTVLDQYGNPAPGSVLSGYGNLAGGVTLGSNGVGTWSDSSLPVGTISVFAEFFPSTGYQQSKGTVNVTVTPLGITPAPSFSPPAGTYSYTQQITLTDTNSNAVMYYTVDGTTPVPGTSAYYLQGYGTIPISASATLNVIAVAPGYSPSSMVSAAYKITDTPDFALALAPSSMSVSPGSPGTTFVNIVQENSFNGTVSLTCSGLPSGASCVFSPASVTGPAGSTLTISEPDTTAMTRSPHPARFFALAFLALFGCIRIRRRTTWLAALIALALPFCALNGCSGSTQSSSSHPTTTTYSVIVTGTSGSLSHSAPLTLTYTN